MSEMHSFGSVNRARRNNIPSGEEIRFALRDKRDVAREKLTRIPGPDLEHDEIRSNGDREGTALPLPLAGEGWGGGAAPIHAVRVERVPPPASHHSMRCDLPRKRERCSKCADRPIQPKIIPL
jgi:hypothetical protein